MLANGISCEWDRWVLFCFDIASLIAHGTIMGRVGTVAQGTGITTGADNAAQCCAPTGAAIFSTCKDGLNKFGRGLPGLAIFSEK